MQPWAPVDVPHVPGGGPPLRLHDTSTRCDPADRARARGPHLRLRDHPLRRHPSRPRGDVPGVRPGQPVLARPGPRRELRPEHHRHRRPAARARRPRPGRLGRARDARDRPVPRGHGGAAGRPAAALHRGGRGDGGDRRAGRQAAGRGRGLPRRRPAVPGRLLRQRRHRALRLREPLRRGDDDPAVPRARRRPGPARQAAPARTRCCGGWPATASRPGRATWARGAPAGTWSAPRSR